jgi:hypothetical protein
MKTQTRRTAARKAAKTRMRTQSHAARSRAAYKALSRQPWGTLTTEEMSRGSRQAARQRTAADRSRSARRAVRTKGPRLRSAAARKAARSRSR